MRADVRLQRTACAGGGCTTAISLLQLLQAQIFACPRALLVSQPVKTQTKNKLAGGGFDLRIVSGMLTTAPTRHSPERLDEHIWLITPPSTRRGGPRERLSPTKKLRKEKNPMDALYIVSLVFIALFVTCIGSVSCIMCFYEPRRPPSSFTLATIVYADPGVESCCCCMDAKANTTLACGHTQLCLQCAQRLTACPLCRHPIGRMST